jgi:hypothetical protein
VMKRNQPFLRTLVIILGFLAIGAFTYMFFVLIKLRPKMVAFTTLSTTESAILTGVGFALLIVLAFFLLSLWQIVRFIKFAEKLTLFSLFLIIAGVLAVLFVFSDIILLGDIAKQHQHELAQPEWSLVFPIMIGQFLVTILFVYLHVTGMIARKQVDRVLIDIHVFLVVHYVGLICGGLGLAMALLGLFFTGGWSLYLHTILTNLILLFPYGLAVIYWIITTRKAQQGEWWDEKQIQDVGKSALLTLGVVMLIMMVLFVTHLNHLDSAIRLQWFPTYLFSTVFTFSLANIIFNSRA